MGVKDIIAADLKSMEGMRLQVYDDATGKPLRPGSSIIGHPTIGYGRALDTNGITGTEAEMLLNTDLARVLALCDTLAYFPTLSLNRQRAVVSLIFQLGAKGYADFKDLNTALVHGDYDAAHDALLASRFASQCPQRAIKLSQWIKEG